MPVGGQQLATRQHSTTFRVDEWSPASRLQRPHYTATVDKHAGTAEVAQWTPATAGRATAVATDEAPQHSDASATMLQQHLAKLQVPSWAVPAAVAAKLAPDPLVLSIEEAAWLALECQALQVFADRAAWCACACAAGSCGAFTPPQLVLALQRSHPDWADRAWLYSWLRRKNWVVRSGVAFAGEYVLYPDGPATGHAVYSLALARALGWSCSWREVMGRLRVASTVSKQLILADMQPHGATDAQYASSSASSSRGGDQAGSTSEGTAGVAADVALSSARSLHTVLFRGVRLDSEAGLKSRRHIRGIVSQWAAAASARGAPSQPGSTVAGNGKKRGISIAILDCTHWSGTVEPSLQPGIPQQRADSAWFLSAAEWIGR